MRWCAHKTATLTSIQRTVPPLPPLRTVDYCVTLTNNNPALIAEIGLNPKVDTLSVLCQVFVNREEKSAFITGQVI